MPQQNIAVETTLPFDFGVNSPVTITNLGPGNVDVHIDYNRGTAQDPLWSSALTGASGIPNPKMLASGANFVVRRTDLEAGHVRIGVHGDTSSGVTVVY
ncbi:hypothetical protein [Paraburkholderia sp.]|uniref:hypothetical protein n=1 Tax=Paraburkholderia sp. TaxID=1926495 RepID=UPI003D6F9D82